MVEPIGRRASSARLKPCRSDWRPPTIASTWPLAGSTTTTAPAETGQGRIQRAFGVNLRGGVQRGEHRQAAAAQLRVAEILLQLRAHRFHEGREAIDHQ